MAFCCCLGCLPLLNGNPPATSDGLYHLLRAAELARQLRAGIAYPRWAPDFYLGYGYPIFLFTPLLPYYLILAVHTLGPALQPAMNVVEAAALVASGLFAYAWLRRTFTSTGAAVGAVLYALAPYHLVNLYYRGDLAEFLAAAWFPAILLALHAMLAAPTTRRAVVLGLTAATLLLTHFISALLFLPVLALLTASAIRWRNPPMLRRQLLFGLGALLLAAGLSAVSWLPAISMAHDATFAKLLRFYSVGENFAGFGEVFSHDALQHYTAIFAGSSGFGYQFGLLQGLALVAGLAGSLLKRRHSFAATPTSTLVFAAVAGLALLGCLRLSAPVWAALPLLQLVQFPWRLLAIAALPAAYFAALAIDVLSPERRLVASLTATGLVTLSCLLLLNPPRIALPGDLTTAAGIARFELLYHLAGTSAAAEYLPPWATQRQMTSAASFALVTGYVPPADPAADVVTWTPSGRMEQFRLTRTKPGETVLPVLYFPGWTATVDASPASIHPAASSGLIALPLTAGSHSVVLRFHAPPMARLGNSVSSAALAVVIAITLLGTARRRRRKHSDTTTLGSRLAPPALGRFLPYAPVAVWIAVALLLAALGGRGIDSGWQPLDAKLAGGIHILGYALLGPSQGTAPEATLHAGQTAQLQVQGAAAGNGRMLAVQLTDAAATDWADWLAPIQAGVTTVPLPLPAALPPGLYALRLGTAAPDGQPSFALEDVRLVRLLPVDGTMLIGPLTVTAPAATAVPVRAPVARWPGEATLGDVSIPATVQAGTTLALAWNWQASALPSRPRLTETVHLVDTAGHVLAATDTEPAAGYFPTPFWSANDVLRDHPVVRLASDVPPGIYAVSVGLRDGTSAVTVQDATGRVLGEVAPVGHVTVMPPATPAAWDGHGLTVGSLAVEASLPVGPVIPGHSLTVNLRWHRPSNATPATTVTLQLTSNGRTFGSIVAPIGGATFPAARWRIGETERQVLDLPVASGAPAGLANVEIAVATNGIPGAATTSLGTIMVAGRPHVYVAQPSTPSAITFADGIQLVGYDLRADGAIWRHGAARASSSLDVTLDWKSAGPTLRPLKVTVQLLSSDNRLLAQADTEPGNGAAPTTSWLAGEIVTSEHHLGLNGVPPGADHLIVALYDPTTNIRVQSAGADSVTLTSVTVP